MDRDTKSTSHRISIAFAAAGVMVSLGGLLLTTSWGTDHRGMGDGGMHGVSPDGIHAPSPGQRAGVASDSALVGLAPDDATSEYLEIVHEGRSSVETVAYLVEWLRANPDGTAELVDILRARAIDGDRSGWSGLLSALGRARTPQADEALVALHADLDVLVVTNTSVHARSMLDRPTRILAATSIERHW